MKVSSFKLTQNFIDNDRFICTDQYFKHASSIPGMTYTKREAIYRFEDWRGYHLGPIFANPKKVFDRVLIVGHSDMPLTRIKALPLKLIGVRKVFGVNAFPFGHFVSPIPIGLTNNTNESELHLVYGNRKHFVRAMQISETNSIFQGKIYANFSNWTFKKERTPLKDLLKNLSFATVQESEATESGRIEFLANLRRHDFVICPRGNGIDTHRIWETLYMGGIPIVRKQPVMLHLLKGLPVLFVDAWTEIANLKFLERKWHEIRSANHEFGKLDIDYWVTQMKRYVNPKRLSWKAKND